MRNKRNEFLKFLSEKLSCTFRGCRISNTSKLGNPGKDFENQEDSQAKERVERPFSLGSKFPRLSSPDLSLNSVRGVLHVNRLEVDACSDSFRTSPPQESPSPPPSRRPASRLRHQLCKMGRWVIPARCLLGKEHFDW